MFGYRAGRAAYRDAQASADAGAAAPAEETAEDCRTFEWEPATIIAYPIPTWPTDDPTPTDITTAAELRQTLQALMWDKVGVTRNEENLTAALQELVTLLRYRESDLLDMSLMADNYAEGVQCIEDRNLLWVAFAVARSALQRRESRGAHHRDDYPQVNDAGAFSRSYVLETPDW